MARPSFVFIMTDSQGANVVGAYGHPGVRTPNLDRLAAGGVRFDAAFTTAPVCTPARAALFTGVYAGAAGAWANNLPLGDTLHTMGQRFRDAGYRTAYTGKWHLDGYDYFGTGGCPAGWDPRYWYDGRNYLEDLSEAERRLWRGGLDSPDALRAHGVTREWTWGGRVTERAIRFLEEATARDGGGEGDDAPFLLVVSYDEPHEPFTCPPEYAEAFAGYRHPLGPAESDDLRDKPAHHREWAASARATGDPGYRANPLYFGCNAFVDDEIGRVLAALDRLAPGDTWVIYTSDHGDMLGAHGLTFKGPAMYDEIVRIPLIVRGPDGRGAGTVATAPVSHIDLLPTMLELAGLPAPPALDGASLVPLLAGGGRGDDRAVVIGFGRFAVNHDSWGGFQPIRCLVDGDYKLAINLLHTDELYDRRGDPAELTNLIADPAHAAARDRLHDRLLDWMGAHGDPFRGPVWERRPWRAAPRLGWTGLGRARRDDGYAPPSLMPPMPGPGEKRGARADGGMP